MRKNNGKKRTIRRAKAGPDTAFWSRLPRPFFALAPMANVTDFVFRSMIAKYGKPDVTWTEFVSADGLNSPGKEKLLVDLRFSKKEKPIVAQLFTGHPEAMKKAAKLCADLGFDGLDINMGCPDRAVERQGGGAAAIKDPENAIAVIEAAREGWMQIKEKEQRIVTGGDGGQKDSTIQLFNNSTIPVSVKTRLGYNKVDFDWLRLLIRLNLPALTVHLRTRKEMSNVSAHWELMPEIVKIRNEEQKDIPVGERTLIIGNGDVESLADAFDKAKKYGCDGVMIGRGIFGAPWFFENCRKGKDARTRTPEERLKIMVEHAKLFEKTFKGVKNFATMKKHFKAYVSGWDGAKELRVRLMETENSSQVAALVRQFLKKQS